MTRMKTEKRNGLLAVSAAADEISRVEIVQLGGLTMGQWYARQASPPDLMLNASLWDGKGAIGTIWQGGKLARNEGAGFGFGVLANGCWGFGGPWDAGWRDYLTGYPGLVRDGKALTHAVDGYVMGAQTRRSVVAAAGNRLYFITADSMTVQQLRSALTAFGAYHAINLDGGGSSRLLVSGKAVNAPTDDRRCPNALAIWLKKGTKEDTSVSKVKVAVDAGHGRHTDGKRCMKALDPKETREWALNSRVAGYVCEHLKASGVTPIRMDDTTGATDVPLDDRTAKANREDCTLYVSIHHDSGINGGTGGGITCFMHPSGSAKAKALRDAIYERTVETTGLRGDRANPKTTANFYVLRKTKMPAALIECGFMDSRTDTPLILTDAFAREAAKGIAEGICATLGITMKEANTMEDKTQTVSDWAKDDWDWAKAQGLLDGTRPRDAVTREELAAVLHRMSKKA